MSVPAPSHWTLDSSTFIHFIVINDLALLIRLRSPLHFPEYVYRVELGLNAKPATRAQAEVCVTRGTVSISRLTIDDLDRIAALSAPRRVGLGEIACAIIAERLQGGVLCDDWRARRWLLARTSVSVWQAIEDVLLDAATRLEITEYDLVAFQGRLTSERYQCRFDLRLEFLQRRLNLGQS
jgi:hypothetical protein